MHVWNELYTWLLLLGDAFVLGRFIELVCCHALRGDRDRHSDLCFIRVCFATFLPLIPIALCWLPLRVYTDWSETFYKEPARITPLPTLIFIGLAAFVFGGLYVLASSSIWRFRGSAPHERVIEAVKIAVGGLFAWILVHVVVENPRRNEVFMAIHRALHDSTVAAAAIYALMLTLLAFSSFIACRELIVWWIKLLPINCLITHRADVIALKDYFRVSRACEVTIGMILDVDWQRPPQALADNAAEIRRALVDAGLIRN